MFHIYAFTVVASVILAPKLDYQVAYKHPTSVFFKKVKKAIDKTSRCNYNEYNDNCNQVSYISKYKLGKDDLIVDNKREAKFLLRPMHWLFLTKFQIQSFLAKDLLLDTNILGGRKI